MNLNEVDSALARGDHEAAALGLSKLLRATPQNRALLERAIDVEIALQRPDAALASARVLHALDKTNLDAQFYLCKALYAARDFDAADVVARALAETPAVDAAVFQLLLGNLCLARQDTVGARAAFTRATQLDPNYAEAFDQVAILAHAAGDLASARSAAEHYARCRPNESAAWFRVGGLCAAIGDVDAATSAYERAIQVDPTSIVAWRGLGVLMAETFQFTRASLALKRVLELDPSEEGAMDLLGVVSAELGETETARAVLSQPSGSNISLGRRVRSALLLPQIYGSVEDVAAWRSRYMQGLMSLEALWTDADGHELPSADVLTLTQSNFLLAYQGEGDLECQRRYADWLRAGIARARPDLLTPLTTRQTGSRIKVVFVSSFFRQCTIGNYFRSWMTDLDPTRFERVVIHTGWQPDAFGEALAQRVDRFQVVRGGPTVVAEAIRREHADILIYPEIGMGAQNYLLANMRLAHVQCAAWGHPVTTGSAEIDVYFSCAEMEPEAAHAHYREELRLLPGLGTNYAAPMPNTKVISRRALGLTDEQHVYICPQSLFKIHPTNDAIFLELLARDDRAVLLFFQATAPAIGRTFAERLGAGLASRGQQARGQLKFLPRQDEAGFRALLALADVVLDTLGWSGGNTSLDAIAAGVPIVTLPGQFMRGRQTRAMLQALGLDQLIAQNADDFVNRAIALAADRAENARVRSQMAAEKNAIFGCTAPITTLAEHCIALRER